jgi:two-component system cell cycle response regulator
MAPGPGDRKPSGPPRLFEKENEEEPTKIGRLEEAVSKRTEGPDKAYFIVLAGSNIGQTYRIEGTEVVLGRASEATIRLPDDGISRRHARVIQRGGELWIEDLKSANGTIINGQRVERRVLKDGDKIEVGSTTILKFSYHDELEESFQQRMYSAALYDGLTKAFNKRHFLDRLPTEVAYAGRHATPLTLLMLDVDHFKDVNDRYGHLAGDHVLATLASIVRESLRTEDIFARYGGEEFAILCRGATLGNAAVLGERLRVRVAGTRFEYQGQAMPVTVSVGIAAYSDKAPDPGTQLVADADAALYEAKRGGRNRVVARPRS